MVQAPYNIIDRRLDSSGWLKKLHKSGVEVHTRSVFLQGLLLMNASNRPNQFSEWNNLWNMWEQWLDLNACSPVEGALNFVLKNRHISRVIVGVDSHSQLLEIVKAVKADLSLTYPQQLSSVCDRLINPAKWHSI